MRAIGDIIVQLGPVFAAIFLMLVVLTGVALVAYSSWQLVKTRHDRPHGHHARIRRSR